MAQHLFVVAVIGKGLCPGSLDGTCFLVVVPVKRDDSGDSSSPLLCSSIALSFAWDVGSGIFSMKVFALVFCFLREKECCSSSWSSNVRSTICFVVLIRLFERVVFSGEVTDSFR